MSMGTREHTSDNVRSRMVFYAVESVRIVTVIAGAYFIVAGLDIIFATILHTSGVELSEAVTWSVLLGFLLYVGIVMWAFAAPKRHRSATVIFGLACLLCCAAVILTPETVA